METMILYVEILWPALLVGFLVLLTHVPLGREVLQRGIIFLDLAIAQIAALGIVIANFFWHDEHGVTYQMLAAIAAAIIGSMGLYRLRSLEVRVQEAIIGILFILAATASILLLSKDPHGGEKIKEILVGQILWLQVRELLSLAVVYAIIITVWSCLRKKIGYWLFYPLFAITITLSTQFIGVYLVFASLIIPALTTLNHSRPLVKGILVGFIGYAGGLFLSAIFDLPAGATIVWVLAFVSIVYRVTSSLVSKV